VYRVKKLSCTELQEFLIRVSPISKVKGIKAFYNIAPNTTNQPRSCFYFRLNEAEIITQVYGLTLPGTDLDPFTRVPGENDPDELPPQLLEVHKFLGGLDVQGTTEWTPDYIEVMLWPWGKNAPKEGVAWPNRWPDLRSERALRGCDLLAQAEFYSVFLDARVFPQVDAVLKLDVDAVDLDGRRWMFDFRYAYPSEPTWRKPFNQPLIDAFLKDEQQPSNTESQ